MLSVITTVISVNEYYRNHCLISRQQAYIPLSNIILETVHRRRSHWPVDEDDPENGGLCYGSSQGTTRSIGGIVGPVVTLLGILVHPFVPLILSGGESALVALRFIEAVYDIRDCHAII